jgi:F-type H+-transporting ATPase subunit c
MMALVAVVFASPLHAQEAARAAGNADVIKWAIITGGFALAIAAAFGAMSQAKGLSAAVEGIARNPSAAGEIRGNLILGLVLIESLVIYVLLISSSSTATRNSVAGQDGQETGGRGRTPLLAFPPFLPIPPFLPFPPARFSLPLTVPDSLRRIQRGQIIGFPHGVNIFSLPQPRQVIAEARVRC